MNVNKSAEVTGLWLTWCWFSSNFIETLHRYFFLRIWRSGGLNTCLSLPGKKKHLDPILCWAFVCFSCALFLMFFHDSNVETEFPQKTTTVFPKLGVIKLLYTLNFDLLPTFIIFFFIVTCKKNWSCQTLILGS